MGGCGAGDGTGGGGGGHAESCGGPQPGDYCCPELLELVTEYLEGALTPEERNRFDRHLGYCPGCVTYLDQVKRTVELCGSVRRVAPPPRDVRERLLSIFRQVRGTTGGASAIGPGAPCGADG